MTTEPEVEMVTVDHLDFTPKCMWKWLGNACDEVAKFICWHPAILPCGKAPTVSTSLIGGPCLQRIVEHGFRCRACQQPHTFADGFTRVEPL